MNSKVKPKRRNVNNDGRRLRTAVVIVDMQNDFCHPDGAFSRLANMTIRDLDGLLSSTNRLVATARQNGHRVIWVRMVWESDAEMGLLGRGLLADEGLRAGTWGAELVDGLDVREQDLQVTKKRFSAFFGTRLEELLREHDVEALVVGGVRTDYCVESTVRDAFFRDLETWVVRECVAGYFHDLHENSLVEMGSIFADVVSLDEAVELLAGEASTLRR